MPGSNELFNSATGSLNRRGNDSRRPQSSSRPGSPPTRSVSPADGTTAGGGNGAQLVLTREPRSVQPLDRNLEYISSAQLARLVEVEGVMRRFPRAERVIVEMILDYSSGSARTIESAILLIKKVENENNRQRGIETGAHPYYSLQNAGTNQRTTRRPGGLSTAGRRSVQMLYNRYRAPAMRAEAEQTELLNQAEEHARTGDIANVTELRERAAIRGELARRLHREAAERIYEGVNAHRPPDEVDLHGLHVPEGIIRLERELHRTQLHEILVITGAGYHSRGIPRMKSAIERWLQQNGYDFQPQLNERGQVGAFLVQT